MGLGGLGLVPGSVAQLLVRLLDNEPKAIFFDIPQFGWFGSVFGAPEEEKKICCQKYFFEAVKLNSLFLIF